MAKRIKNKETKRRLAFNIKYDLKKWIRDNCRDCQSETTCKAKDHIGMEMEVGHAFNIGYEDVGFGYISLHDTCRMKFPKRNGSYHKVGQKKSY